MQTQQYPTDDSRDFQFLFLRSEIRKKNIFYDVMLTALLLLTSQEWTERGKP